MAVSKPTQSEDLRWRVARAGALLCSLTLGLFVIVNAQFGCDSQGSTAPANGAKQVEPAKQAEPAKQVEPAKQAEPAKPAEPTPAQVEPTPEVQPEPEPEPPKERVFMPASKSAGDFGGPIPLPPEPQQQQANQAPQP